ncbi:MAG: hypothetical protein U0176_13965 [Bacteroidia bacterium]
MITRKRKSMGWTAVAAPRMWWASIAERLRSWSKLVNYGKRLMFEFLIPEPAAAAVGDVQALRWNSRSGDPSTVSLRRE